MCKMLVTWRAGWVCICLFLVHLCPFLLLNWKIGCSQWISHLPPSWHPEEWALLSSQLADQNSGDTFKRLLLGTPRGDYSIYWPPPFFIDILVKNIFLHLKNSKPAMLFHTLLGLFALHITGYVFNLFAIWPKPWSCPVWDNANRRSITLMACSMMPLRFLTNFKLLLSICSVQPRGPLWN